MEKNSAAILRTRDGRPITLQRIERALRIAAELAEVDPVYTPIFVRMDAEYSAALAGADPVARMRAKVRMGAA